MKKLLPLSSILFGLLLLGVLLISCSESKFQTLREVEVDIVQRDLAESLASDILLSMKSGEFKTLGNEATISMQNGLSPEKQKLSFEYIKSLFGDYQSLFYYETCVPNDGTSYAVYRFKGKFESSTTAEIRVVINKNNKLSGFFIKEWKDIIQ
jgi:uncharacterized protein DUF3887